MHEKNYYFVFALECYARIEEKQISSISVTGRSYGEGRVVWGFRVIFDKNLSEKKIVSYERVHEKN